MCPKRPTTKGFGAIWRCSAQVVVAILLRLARKGNATTPEERERMNALCRQIQDEKDQHKFSALIEALNRLLAKKDERVEKTLP